MFAARDQENLVHARQTTGAAKPLNQGVKHLQPKTPGSKALKTPFKIPLNDENDPLRVGGKTGLKAIGKGNENVLQSNKEGGGIKNVFITPGPRDRAPLGLKTKDAKGKAFQTPAPLDQSIKTQKRSSTRRAKVHHDPVQESTTGPLIKEDGCPEVEYAPPPAAPLPDPPIEITYDDTFPQFKGENMTRGWWDEYANQKGNDGLTDWERNDKREQEEHEKRVDAMIQKTLDEMEIPGWNVRAFPDEECIDEREERAKRQNLGSAPAAALVKKPQLLNPRTARAHPAPSTIRSRNAASALSHTKKPATSKSTKAVRPNTATKPKVPAFLSGIKPTPAPSNPSTMRHTASNSISRQTLGYSKGRSVSGVLRPTLKSSTFDSPRSTSPTETKEDYSHLPLPEYIKKRGVPPVGSEMWYLANDLGYFENATDALEGKLKAEQGLEGLFADADVGETEEEEVFQLSLEGLELVD